MSTIKRYPVYSTAQDLLGQVSGVGYDAANIKRSSSSVIIWHLKWKHLCKQNHPRSNYFFIKNSRRFNKIFSGKTAVLAFFDWNAPLIMRGLSVLIGLLLRRRWLGESVISWKFLFSSELNLCTIVPFSLPMLSWLWFGGWWAVCAGLGILQLSLSFVVCLFFSITIKVFGEKNSNLFDNFENIPKVFPCNHLNLPSLFCRTL